jgi:Pyruvate/2-oxoacid:ferredoxin oxidoreductase gamma subunit
MVALGAVAALNGVVKLESLKKSLRKRVPNKTTKQNLDALAAGYEAAGRGAKHSGNSG